MKIKLLPLFLMLPLLASCSTQYRKSPDGSVTVNNNILSRGAQTIGADGSIHQEGNAEEAVTELGKYGMGLNVKEAISPVTVGTGQAIRNLSR